MIRLTRTAITLSSSLPLLASGMTLSAQDGRPQPAVSALTLFHVRIPSRLSVDTTVVQARYDSVLVVALQGTGCHVVPSAKADSVFALVTDSVGGYFDRNTGALDERRFGVVMQLTLRKLAHDFGVRNTIFPRVDEVAASLDGGLVKWDGTNQAYRNKATGSVRASSLTLYVLDSLGATQYTRRGGIELLERGSPFSSAPKPFQPSELFRDVERLQQSVNIALSPMYSRLAAWCNPT